MAELSIHPAWPMLERVAKDRMTEDFARLARELMRGKEIAQTEIEYRRGFFAGMKFLLDHPTLEATRIERALAERR